MAKDEKYRLEPLEERRLLSAADPLEASVAGLNQPGDTMLVGCQLAIDEQAAPPDRMLFSYNPEACLGGLFDAGLADASSPAQPGGAPGDALPSDRIRDQSTTATSTEAVADTATLSTQGDSEHTDESSVAVPESAEAAVRDAPQVLVETLRAGQPPPGCRLYAARVDKGANLTLCLNAATQDHLELVDDGSGAIVASWALADTSGVRIIGAESADDRLTVDTRVPFWLQDGIEFTGGGGGFDSLVLKTNDTVGVGSPPGRRTNSRIPSCWPWGIGS